MKELNVEMEVGTAVQFDEQFLNDANQLLNPTPMNGSTQKGKKFTPIHVLSHQSETMSSSSNATNASQDSVAGPHPGKVPMREAPRSAGRTLGTVVKPSTPASKPTCSTASFRPPIEYSDVFEKAKQSLESRFLTRLKNASFPEVEGIGSQASACYQSIRQLKHDPTPLMDKVDSYVGSVQAYLALERTAHQYVREEELQSKMAAQAEKIERSKSQIEKIQDDCATEAAKRSTLARRIADLEAELKKVREEDSALASSLEAKRRSLPVLQDQIEADKKLLADLEATPIMSSEDEARIKEQRTTLEAMRDSLI